MIPTQYGALIRTNAGYVWTTSICQVANKIPQEIWFFGHLHQSRQSDEREFYQMLRGRASMFRVPLTEHVLPLPLRSPEGTCSICGKVGEVREIGDFGVNHTLCPECYGDYVRVG